MGKSVVEICAGAGGQALGLELAGFEHELAVELDDTAADTLNLNRPDWLVRRGDVASQSVWKPSDYAEIDLLAGGVPCPPFSMAGKQLGANDERDLFAWAVETAGKMQPRAIMLENVRGLSMPRFAGYRQQVAERLAEHGYVSSWKLLEARDYGVSQLRPRFVLVALKPEDADWFRWPEPQLPPLSVGELLEDLMAANEWSGAHSWAEQANAIAPTIVGGSKKHGGADLGPTRAKAAWAKLGVDGRGIADAAPSADLDTSHTPRLTTEMVARIQGWLPTDEYSWEFAGKKTSKYRQVGNAFPPPVARAVGTSIMDALDHRSTGNPDAEGLAPDAVHDPVVAHLRSVAGWTLMETLERLWAESGSKGTPQGYLRNLERDFNIEYRVLDGEMQLRLDGFKGFIGQDNHMRNEIFSKSTSSIS